MVSNTCLLFKKIPQHAAYSNGEMAYGANKWIVVISSLIVFLASIFLRYKLNHDVPEDIRQVIQSLYQLECSYRPLPQRKPGPKVLVGFGGCVDLRVRAVELFKSMKISNLNTQPITSQRNISELNTLEDFIWEFQSAFKSGVAVERVIHNKTMFRELVSAAAKLVPFHLSEKLLPPIVLDSHLDPNPYSDERITTSTPPLAWWSLGGNAPVMASRLAREGAQVSLAARLSHRERSHLHTGIKVLMAPPKFGLSETPEEDVHLVLEYELGDKWGNLVAPRANRYIVLHDTENPLLSGLWPGLLHEWRRHGSGVENSDNESSVLAPDLFVLGGLQVMDNWLSHDKTDLRSSRLEELGEFLTNLSPHTLVHFEMASFVNREFSVNLLKTILPHVDSIGLNEQELPNLASLLSNSSITSISTAYPRAANMLDYMRTVWASMNDPNLPRVNTAASPKWRRLSRIHLHTLAYQMIMVRRHAKGGAAAHLELESRSTSGLFTPRRTDIGLAWPFTRAAAAKASLIAHRHTCAASSINPVQTRLLIDDSFALTADPYMWKSVLKNHDSKNIPRIHFNHTSPVTCWTEPEPTFDYHSNQSNVDQSSFESNYDTQIEICVAPVLVCSQVKQTAGAGDNISAGALRSQIVSYVD